MLTRLLPIAFLFVGCATGTPSLTSEELQVNELWYGRYVDSEGAVRGETTLQLSCEPNLKYGAEVQVTFETAQTTRIPVAGVLFSPPVEGVHSGGELDLLAPLFAPETWGSISLKLVGGFQEGVELVNGPYEIRLFNPDTDNILYTKTFEVSGCP